MTYRKSLLAGIVLAPLGLLISGSAFAESVTAPVAGKNIQIADNEPNEQGASESQDGNQEQGNAESNDGESDDGNVENGENGNEQADSENGDDDEKCVKNCPETGETGENNN